MLDRAVTNLQAGKTTGSRVAAMVQSLLARYQSDQFIIRGMVQSRPAIMDVMGGVISNSPGKPKPRSGGCCG